MPSPQVFINNDIPLSLSSITDGGFVSLLREDTDVRLLLRYPSFCVLILIFLYLFPSSLGLK